MHFISTLQDLSSCVQVDGSYISAPVTAVDKVIMSQRPTGQKYMARQDSRSRAENKQKEKVEDSKKEVDDSPENN